MVENEKQDLQTSSIEDTSDSFDSFESSEMSGQPAFGAELISALVLLVFGLYVLLSGLYMCFFAVTGTDIWYYSPGFFPVFIGTVLILLSFLLFRKKTPPGGVKDVDFHIFKNMRSVQFIRLITAIGLFAAYVFMLIGNLPFWAATFLYLSVNMVIFRSRGFPVWKLLLISALTTALVCFFFGVVAAVPLP